ncbi:MAG: CPBP family intramembrane metalloprotease [Flavobacteriales bacterium]|nr:CPBP family intramembrane metalloprotease [Flavobacteriales bacterium]
MSIFICSNCDISFNDSVKFCTQCGANLLEKGEEENSKYITKSVVFYLTFITYIVVYYILSPEFLTLGFTLFLEGIFAVLILTFCLFDLKKIVRLFRIPKVNIWVYVFIFIFPVISAFIVSISMEYINSRLFGFDSENLYLNYIAFENPILWSFIFISFVPAVFEELGFRGYLFNQLLKITSPKVTILITAFLFALMHFSFVSIVWIFPFGLVLGYLRLKHNTIWFGMIIHFIHNSVVLLIDMSYYEVFFNDNLPF